MERVFGEINRKHFQQCETLAAPLLSLLLKKEEIDLIALTQSLGTCLEYILCNLFKQGELSSAYWVDGVIITSIELQSIQTININGYAWCAQGSREQWQIPIQVSLDLSGEALIPNLARLHIHVGDVACQTLTNHRFQRWQMNPELWILNFFISCPTMQNPQILIDHLQNWVEVNSIHALINQDWQPQTLDQAIEYIRNKTTDECEVILEETWLDGGIALRIT